MKKMIKGFAIVTTIASMTMFMGCSKASKYESICEELIEIGLEMEEALAKKQLEFEVKDFKEMDKETQDEVLKELEDKLKDAKKVSKKKMKAIKEAEDKEDLFKAMFTNAIKEAEDELD